MSFWEFWGLWMLVNERCLLRNNHMTSSNIKPSHYGEHGRHNANQCTLQWIMPSQEPPFLSQQVWAECRTKQMQVFSAVLRMPGLWLPGKESVTTPLHSIDFFLASEKVIQVQSFKNSRLHKRDASVEERKPERQKWQDKEPRWNIDMAAQRRSMETMLCVEVGR